MLHKEAAGITLPLLYVKPACYKRGNARPDFGLRKMKKAIHVRDKKKHLTYSLKIEV